jgi:hypothetical protein
VGLGNVYKSRRYIFAGLYLCDMGSKLLYYPGSNKPRRPYNSIGFYKLVEHLGYTEEYLKQQGAPRVRKWIGAGFKELQGIGHIEKYSYDKKEDVFKWTCTTEIFKFTELIEKSNKKLITKSNKKKNGTKK